MLKHESHEYFPLSKHGDSEGVAANLIIFNHVCQAFLHGWSQRSGKQQTHDMQTHEAISV